ncbi:10042_t:CDS:2 [Diversispora eburnea]|uniref:10042_t:CDS:1 n=1 Tax=Diversispora eburnea TaxID=1213867 RepID=A0A9N8WPY2_9GLOM|nr:10042_t:CDS:2 [Diversispora eburnea]
MLKHYTHYTTDYCELKNDYIPELEKIEVMLSNPCQELLEYQTPFRNTRFMAKH